MKGTFFFVYADQPRGELISLATERALVAVLQRFNHTFMVGMFIW